MTHDPNYRDAGAAPPIERAATLCVSDRPTYPTASSANLRPMMLETLAAILGVVGVA